MTLMFYAGAEADMYCAILRKHNYNVLMSFFHIPPKYKKVAKIKEMLGIKTKLFIDSGAFSAWSLGRHIKLDDYIDFCKRTDADYYAVYDSIGDPEKTLENQKYMESKGIKPIPCFHFGEDWKYIEYYCKHYDYIAIGGMVGNRGLIKTWLEVLFTKYPNKKFHGFGLTTVSLIKPFPWYSVDSSSWLMGARSGQLYHFEHGNLYYKNLEKDLIKSNLFLKQAKEYNLTKEDLLESHVARTEFSAREYNKIEQINNSNFKLIQNTLTSFGAQSVNTFIPQEMVRQECRKDWILRNYGNVPENIAEKLITHQFK